jgi:hypothetical protein
MEDKMDSPWMPESILVRTREGREPICTAPCLTDEQDEYASVVRNEKGSNFCRCALSVMGKSEGY